MSTAPKYMSQFQCVGGACEETCCADFLIDIDRRTFDRFMAVPGALGQDLRTFVRKRERDVSPDAYAQIAMTASGECPFLDDRRLCSIQGALGEGALSHTCREFPRARWTRDGVPYLGGKLSCPEAARLCVASADAMDMDRGVQPVATLGDVVHRAVEAAARDTAAPVWKAILLAGELAEALLPGKAASASSEDLAGAREKAAGAWAGISAAGFSTGDEGLLQMRLLMEIGIKASAKCNARRNRFPRLAQAAMGAIFEGADDFEGAARNYRRLYREGFARFEETHDHALRNYVLNYLFNNQSFVSGPPLRQIQSLAVRYGVIRLLLIGLAGTRPLSLGDCATVISAASRILDHDATVGADIWRALDAVEPQSTSLAARMVIPPAG